MCSSTVSDPANMRIHGAQHASMRKKKSSAILLFEAVADLWSAPDSPRERGDSRGWKPQVSTLLCARAASAQLPRRNRRNSPSQRLAATPAPQDTAVKTCRKNWLSTLSTGLSTRYLGITLCIKWITFCIHPRRPPYISVFRLRIVISAVEKPPLHNPPHLVENL